MGDFDVIHEFLSCYCELLLNWGVFHEFLSCYYRLLLNWVVLHEIYPAAGGLLNWGI